MKRAVKRRVTVISAALRQQTMRAMAGALACCAAIAAAEPASQAARDDWEFQFRTMGYGTIDLRSDAAKHYDDAQRRKKGDSRGESRMRGIAAMIEYWRARNPTEEERKRLDDTERRLQALRAALEGVPDVGPEAHKKWPHFDVEDRILRGIVQLRPEPIGPRPQLLRNDETAPGVSLDDPPLLDRQAKFWPEDRDQVDVVLRRTRALIGYWLAKEPAQARWKTFREELRGIESAAQVTQPDLTRTDAARHRVYLDLCALRRRVALANPLLDFEDLVFIEHSDVGNYLDRVRGNGVPRPGGGLYALRGFKGDAPRVEDLIGNALPENGDYAQRGLTNGVFQRPEVSFDGQTIWFAWAELVPGKPRMTGPYHIFRVQADGTGLRQVTFGPRSDVEPCELPNGRIVFCSTRRVFGDRCCGMNRPSFFLHAMPPDGSDIIPLSFHETHEWEPSVDNDGMLVYTRWDYVDRPPAGPRNLWLCFPDGSNPRSPHGNNGPNALTRTVFIPPIPGYFDSPAHGDWRKAAPLSEVSVRAIPGSHRYLAVAGQHDWNGIGPLVMIDPRIPDDYLHSQITRVTPEFYEHNNEVHWNMVWATPWPLSEDFYLVNRYESIGILDRFGNFEPLHRMVNADGANRAYAHKRSAHCWGAMGVNVTVKAKSSEVDGMAMFWRPIYPMPLRSRPRPPVLPARTYQEAGRRGSPEHKPASLSVMNVYDTDVPLPAGAKAKWLRIVQILPFGNCPFGNLNSVAHVLNRTVLGVVPVEEDGSVYCEAPVGRGIYFQLLDEDGVAIHGMQSDTYVHPGEHLSCAGCHEKNSTAPPSPKQPPLALRRPPSRIQPECADLCPTLLQRHIVPILDGVCIRCHRQERRGPEVITWKHLEYNQAQRTIGGKNEMRKFITRPTGPRTVPGEFGASSTFTWKHAMGHKSAFTGDQLRRLAQFLDLYWPMTATGNPESARLQEAGELEWPRHAEFDPANPLGLERVEESGRDGPPDAAAWAAALSREATDEGRTALLDNLGWRIGTNVFSWGEHEDPVIKALIPMLASPLVRTHGTALGWLHAIADRGDNRGQHRLPGDPGAWLKHYERTYPGKTLDMVASIRERWVVVKVDGTNEPGFAVEGEDIRDAVALEGYLGEQVKQGRDKGVAVKVAVVNSTRTDRALSMDGGIALRKPTDAELVLEDVVLAAWRGAGDCRVCSSGTIRATAAADRPLAPPRIGVPLPSEPEALARLLGHLYYSVRSVARKTLVAQGDEAVPALRKALGHDYWAVRQQALVGLRELGVRAAPALPDVAARLAADEAAVNRSAAMDLLATIGTSNQPVVASVAHLLPGENGEQAEKLLRQWLALPGAQGEAVKERLRAIATGGEGKPMQAVARLLVMTGTPTPFAIVAAEYSRNPAQHLAWFQEMIARHRYPAAEVTPFLEAQLRKSDVPNLSAIAGLVSRYAQEAGRCAPGLVLALQSKDPGIRQAAARTLGDLGAAEALPALRRTAKDDPDGAARRDAEEAILAIGEGN